MVPGTRAPKSYSPTNLKVDIAPNGISPTDGHGLGADPERTYRVFFIQTRLRPAPERIVEPEI